MAYENIQVSREGPVATITVNRPKALNALNSATLRELLQAVREAAESSRALILTGAGEKAFVAGADISEMAPMTPWSAREFSELGHVLTASENAKVGFPEVTLGITPGFGGTQRLVRLVGKLRAKEIIFTGDMVDAKQALEIGLVNAVLPRGELMAHCRKVAEKIATRGPLAVARAKRLVERGYDIPLRAANRQEAETFALLFDTQDRAEGMRAFLEKRPARFVGK